MTQALGHIGLSLAIVFAPALCCCNARWIAGFAQAAPLPCPTQPEKEPACCQKAQSACCHQEADPEPQPTAPPPSCVCYTERPVATPPELKPDFDPPTAGEWVAITDEVLSPEHNGQLHGSDPGGHTGVDTRFATLFERHVLRC